MSCKPEKAVYKGPPHYWHWYALNPREKYYYSYYGYYGPSVMNQYYQPIVEHDNLPHLPSLNLLVKEGFSGGECPQSKFLPIIIVIALITAFIAMKK